MASEATPRINAHYLEKFMNQTVRILGKVVSLRGETATIDANGSITIHLNRVRGRITWAQTATPLLRARTNKSWSKDSHLALNNAVEVVGKVQQDLSIRVFQATDFGSGIGMHSRGYRLLQRALSNWPVSYRLQGC